MGAAGSLLIAVEPATEREAKGDSVPSAPTGDATGRILVTEGLRLARELGVAPYFVTWSPGRESHLEGLARALVGAVEEARPKAALFADTVLGRQLASMVAHGLSSGAVIGCSDSRVRGGFSQVGAEDRGEALGNRCADVRFVDSSARQVHITFAKPVYGGWLEREVESVPGKIPVATLDLAGMEEPDALPDGLPSFDLLGVEVEVEPGLEPRVRRLELVPPDARSVDLVHADRIVAAGAGSASGGLLAAVAELAELLEGSIGTTRPVVDDGLLPKERLIGQTGRTVSPQLYVALGISGSPHHMAGVRKADRILSINRDIRAPVFGFSDVGYVADLELVLPGLVQRIRDWRDGSESRE
jgi:electron transfer flavoprotein alpha subunit